MGVCSLSESSVVAEVGSSTADGQDARAGGAVGLVRDLTGDLPCANCGYNLRGLSIRELCPECGMAVRATILAVVDPRAGELKPVAAPRVVSAALVVWPAAALLAALCVWVLRGADVAEALAGVRVDVTWLGRLSVWLLLVSGVASVALVRPIHGVRARDTVRAALGVVAFGALIWAHAAVVRGLDLGRAFAPYVGGDGPDTHRAVLRLVVAVCAAGVVLAFRPNLGRLAYRSVVIRTGRVDRQPMTALVAALGLAAVGDVMTIGGAQLGGVWMDVSAWVSLVLIAVGSFLFTLGLWGMVADGWRVGRVVRTPSLGLTDIMGDPHPGNGAATGGRS
jgi:hypothetical protein